ALESVLVAAGAAARAFGPAPLWRFVRFGSQPRQAAGPTPTRAFPAGGTWRMIAVVTPDQEGALMKDPEHRLRDVALFRYSLIREAADPRLTPRQRRELVRALAAVEHLGPAGTSVKVSRPTLDRR